MAELIVLVSENHFFSLTNSSTFRVKEEKLAKKDHLVIGDLIATEPARETRENIERMSHFNFDVHFQYGTDDIFNIDVQF